MKKKRNTSELLELSLNFSYLFSSFRQGSDVTVYNFILEVVKISSTFLNNLIREEIMNKSLQSENFRWI